jgi:hypothetical protein
MNCLQERLASLTDTAASLIAELRELNRLHERVRGREAQLANQRSFRTPLTTLRPDGPPPTRKKRP